MWFLFCCFSLQTYASLFLFGQLTGIGFSRVIICGVGVLNLLTDLLLLWGDSRSFNATLWEGSSFVEFCLYNFWDFVGSLKIGCRLPFWLGELVGEALI